jgi:hypothetical protein
MKRIKLDKFLPSLNVEDLYYRYRVALDRLRGVNEYEQLHRQLEQVAFKNESLARTIQKSFQNLSREQGETFEKYIPILISVSEKILNREKVTKSEVERYVEATKELSSIISQLPKEISSSIEPIVKTLVKVLENEKVSTETKFQIFQETLQSLKDLGSLPEELSKYQAISQETFLKYQSEILKTLKSKETLREFEREQQLTEILSKFNELLQSKELLERTKKGKSLAERFLEEPVRLARGRTLLAGTVETAFSLFGMPTVGSVIGDILESGIGSLLLFKGLGKIFRLGSILRPSGLKTVLRLGRGLTTFVKPTITSTVPLGIPKLAGSMIHTTIETPLATKTSSSLLSRFVGFTKRGTSFVSKLGSIARLGKFAKFVPIVGTALTIGTSLFDAFTGWNEAERIFGTKKATLGQKISSSIGSLISGLTFGLLSKESVAKAIYSAGNYLFGGQNQPSVQLSSISDRATQAVSKSSSIIESYTSRESSSSVQPVVIQQQVQPPQQTQESPAIPTQKYIDSYGIAFTNALLFE